MKFFLLKVIHFLCCQFDLVYMYSPDNTLEYCQSTQKKQIINREDIGTYFHLDANDVQIRFSETKEYH